MSARLLSREASFQPELYALGTGADLDADFGARNGEARLNPIPPDEHRVGVAWGGSVSYAIPSFFALSARLEIRAPRFESCVVLDAWAPFSEERLLSKFAFGAHFGLSGFRR